MMTVIGVVITVSIIVLISVAFGYFLGITRNRDE